MKKFLTYFGALGTHRVHNKTAPPQRGTADIGLKRTAGFGIKRTDGFGLIEVLCAAVVLGFMLVGLAVLQKGNREGIIRVRARDSANFVAHHILDSLSGVGLNSLVPDSDGDRCPPETGKLANAVYKNCEYIYTFEGHPQRDKSIPGIKSEIKYSVEVSILGSTETKPTEKQVIDSTKFTIANRGENKELLSPSEINTYSKSLNATVSWEFKKSTQSIHIAKVVR